DGIRDRTVTGVQTCALPICADDHRLYRRAADDGGVVARRDPRGDLPGLPQPRGAAWPALRHGLVHRLRGDVLFGILLGVLLVERSEERRVGKGCSHLLSCWQ